MTEPQANTPKPFLGIHMKCCNIYIRVNRNADNTAYVGWCPRCAAQVRVPIVAQGGSNDRFFSAS